MLAVKESDLCDQATFSDCFSRVFNGEPILISDSQNRKAVLIPFDEFDALWKTRKESAYWAEIDRRFEDVKHGRALIRKTMEELEAMAGAEEADILNICEKCPVVYCNSVSFLV